MGKTADMKIERQEVLCRLRDLACGNPTGAVKLAISGGDTAKWPRNIDLTQIQAIKRMGNGSLEVEIVDRVKAFDLLLKNLEGEEGETQWGSLIRALEKNGPEEL